MSGTDTDLWGATWQEHIALAARVNDEMRAVFKGAVEICYEALSAGRKLMLFGNGGSAADAQHIAAEFSVKLAADRPAMAAMLLSADPSSITACGNDYGFEHIFARQIAALGREGDVAIGFSTSGNSPNVLRALETARQSGLGTIGFTGNDGGRMRDLCDASLVVPITGAPARIQEMHITLGHLLCAELERRLGLVRANS